MKYSFNQRGSVQVLLMALIGTFVAMASTLAMMNTIETDNATLNYQQDAVQEEVLIRSENRRAIYTIQSNEIVSSTQARYVVKEPNRVTTYTLDARMGAELYDAGEQDIYVTRIKVRAKAKRGSSLLSGVESPVERLSSRILRRNSLAQYHYFTNTEKSSQGDELDAVGRVVFYAADRIHGPVFSNDDIILANTGTPPDGVHWPIFYDHVTTAGEIKYWNGSSAVAMEGNIPEEIVFPAGYTMHADPIIFLPEALSARQFGRRLNIAADSDDIIYIDLGSTTAMLGRVNRLADSLYTVYDVYPDPSHPNWPIGRPLQYFANTGTNAQIVTIKNRFAQYDTVWATASAVIANNSSIYIPSGKVWVKGAVSGKKTIAAADTVYITGDITYANTPPNLNPDDPTHYNRYDMFGLVSEKSILLRYKNPNPFEDPNNGYYPREFNNVASSSAYDVQHSDGPGVWLYGCFAALGEGDPDTQGDYYTQYDGVFSFEYQHPHGSTPNMNWTDPISGRTENLMNIDLHKHIFVPNVSVPAQFSNFWVVSGDGSNPTSGYNVEIDGNNYVTASTLADVCHPEYSVPDNPVKYTNPSAVRPDWPWYNPVWPEKISTNHMFYQTSGTDIIHLRGSIAQRRRGFVRRSCTDGYNHGSDGAIWDISHFRYGGNHRPTGYDKDYVYDSRLKNDSPPDFPEIYNGWGEVRLSAYTEDNFYFMAPQNWSN